MTDLSVESLSKCYRVQGDSGSVSSGLLGKLGRSFTPKKEFWAVRDLTFEVKRGESLGIIGHNGAGKSTVLKLLSNITAPTAGKITINGRISALLEVGSGFHPDLTGRENTYLSGSILGMRRTEITAKLDSIIEFAGIRPFIDVPVKRYSSGMYVRLGFAIAAHLSADILLLDEVLAVGDLAFQEKCKTRIAELHRQGTTMIFISHDLTAVRNLCERVILLQRGQIVSEGSADEVVRRYTQHASFRHSSRIESEQRMAEVTSVAFYDEQNNVSTSFSTGGPLKARVDYLIRQEIADAAVALYFTASDGETIATLTTALDGALIDLPPGRGTVEFSCDQLGLQPGVYHIDVCILRPESKQEFEWQQGCASIHVDLGTDIRGRFYMPHVARQIPG